jgi:autotransporter-associated beta strand protein
MRRKQFAFRDRVEGIGFYLGLALSLAFVGQGAQAQPVCDALWTFNGNTYDSTANSNSGTVNGSASYNAAATIGGVSQQSINIGSTVGVTDLTAVNLPVSAAAAWTENVWLNLSSTPPSLTYLAGFGNYNAGSPAGNSRGFLSYGNASNVGYYFWGDSADYYSTVQYNATSTWHMYTITYDGANIRMYLDGTQQGVTTAKTLTNAPSYLHVGNPSNWHTTGLTESVADFSVWTGTMTASQINYLLTNGTASALPSTLTWTGTASQNWNTSAVNWSSFGAATTYADGKPVQFDDTAGSVGGSTTIAVNAANVSPLGVAFNNSAYNFTLTGPFGISGAVGLTKSGSGLVTITNSNAYTGTTTISAGTLQIGNGTPGNDGTLTGTSGIVNNSALVYNLASSQTVSGIAITGTGTTTISTGTLGLLNAFGTVSPIAVSASAALILNNQQYSGYSNRGNAMTTLISGPGTININCATGGINGGWITFGTNPTKGLSNFTGTVNINSGVVTMDGLGGAWSGNPTLNVYSGGLFGIRGQNIAVDGLNGNGDVMNDWSGDTGGHTFTVGANNASGTFTGVIHGSNTGADGSIEAGILNLAKAGSGLQVLTGVNTYIGTTTISGGTLQLGTGQNGQDGSISASSGVTNNASLVYNLYGNQAVPYTISGSGSLTKLGPGALTINANTSGPITVAAGSLYLNNFNSGPTVSVCGGATLGGAGSGYPLSVTVADSGTLDFSQNSSSNFLLANLTLGGSVTLNAGQLNYFYTSTPFLSTGTLTNNSSTVTVNANFGQASVLSGTYDIVGINTSDIGGVPTLVQGTVYGLSNRQTANLTTNGSYVVLVVAGPTPYWSGSQPDWTSSNAWTLQPDNTPTTFLTGDTDIFDDSANGSLYGGTVALNSSNVAPSSLTFSNSSLVYTVSGSYGITGSASLSVNGAGMVTIATSNSYSGGTHVSSGLLNANAPSALGTGTVTVTGGVLDDGAAQSLGTGQLVINGGSAIVSNPQSSASVTLGAAQLILAGSAASLGSGTLGISGGTMDNTSGGPLTLAGNNPQRWSNSFTFLGTNPLNLGTGAVTMNASPTVKVLGSSLTVGGPISGNGLTLTGSGALVLTATNTYAGATNVNGGTMQLGDGTPGHDGTLATSSVVVSNAALAYNLAGSQTISYPITGVNCNLIKSGTGQVTFNNTGAVSFGNGSSGLYVNAGLVKYTGIPSGSGLYQTNIFINGGATLEMNITSGTNNLGAFTRYYTGAGTLNQTGAGILDFGGYGGGSYIDFSPGALIHVSGGTLVGGNYNAGSGCTWTGNYASMTLDANTTFDFYGFSAQVDALNGAASSVITNRYPNALTLTVGAAGGSGTYAGTIQNGNGTMYLTVSGSGSEVLSGSNTYTGTTTISNGTLQIGVGGTTGSISPSSAIINNSILAFNRTDNYGGLVSNLIGGGGILEVGGGSLTLTGAKTYSGATSVNGGTLQLGTGQNGQDGLINNTSGVTNNATMAYNLYGNQFIPYSISGSGNLTKLGSGQLSLGGNNGYTGTTTVGSGGLYLNGFNSTLSISVSGAATLGGSGSAPSAGANIANGGILDFSQNTATTFGLTSLTLAGSSTMNVGGMNSYYTTSPFLSVGSLTTAGSININANLGSSTVTSGTYDIVSFTGSIGGSGSGAFHLASVAGLNSRQHASLADISNQIDLIITGATPYWNGNQPDWRSTNAWTLQPVNTPTTFQANDTEIFDDSAIGSTYGGTVLLTSGNVAPASMNFNNSSLDYTVSGNYGITGSATLSVNNGGTVTIATSNSYTGGTNLVNGVLNANATSALGAGTISVSSNGVLNANVPSALGTCTVNVNGGLLNDGATNSLGTGPLAINGGTVYINFAQSLASISLGAALLNISDTAATLGSGTLSITGGTIDNTSGSPVTLAGNGPQQWSGPLTFLGTYPLNMGTGAVRTLSATPTVNIINANSLTVGGVISGSNGLTLAGNGALVLTATNAYTGVTAVNGGTLQLGDGTPGHDGTLANNSFVQVTNSTVVYDIAGSQTINYPVYGTRCTLVTSGTGQVTFNNTGAVGFGSNGSTLAVNGGSAKFTGLLNNTGLYETNITINSGATLEMNVAPGITNNFGAWFRYYNGGGTLLKTGGGTLDFGGYGSGTANVDFSVGALIHVAAGTLVGSHPGNFNFNAVGIWTNNNASLTVDSGATFDLNGSNTQVDALNGAAMSSIRSSGTGSISLTTGVADGSGTFAGTISDGAGTIALHQTGTGTLVLSGTNAYSGGTFVDNGTLIATNAGAIADGTSLTVGDASAFPAATVPSSEAAGTAAPPIAPVPEPGTLVLMSIGMLPLLYRRGHSRMA